MIHPVILAGGSGTRLWPLSRKSYPKQFAAMGGKESLFQKTARRLTGPSFAAPTIVTHSDFRFIVAEQISETQIEPTRIIVEPQARNTAPAILSAALMLASTPDALMLVVPSDHAIDDSEAFSEAVLAGVQAANQGQLVTFGVEPNSPATGYGYLEIGDTKLNSKNGARDLLGFVEKPDVKTARAMLESKNFLWNAGIFLFRVGAIIEAFEITAPQLVAPCRAAVAAGRKDLCFFRLGEDAYQRAENISIDYAVMEVAETLSVVKLDCGWSDVGSWKSLWKHSNRDAGGNTLSGSVTSIDCKRSLLRSENENLHLVGLGLTNIAAIAMNDAVLVANLDDSERVKEVVAELKIQNIDQAEGFPRCHRPWGYYETLSLGGRFQVKRIMVHPGETLSLQSHVHRAEHWVVVEGSAKVTVDDGVDLVSENQSVFIPLGATHRLENPGKVPLNLIEVQTGAYLGEDDIIRYDDVYERHNAA